MVQVRIQVHGDYHLGQLLETDGDFIIIDFEGEPARPLHERRLKRSPLRDVAGMLRSYHYAFRTALYHVTGGDTDPLLSHWARLGFQWTSATFLQAYLQAAATADILPTNRQQLDQLLGLFLLEKATYELNYELNNRPDWVTIPLQGILELVSPDHD